MKRKLLVLLLAIVSCFALVFGLAACDNGNNGGNGSTGGNGQGSTQTPPSGGNGAGGGNQGSNIPAEEQITVKVIVEGKSIQTLYTDKTKGYTISEPETPKDITTDYECERYFDGWYLDSDYITPFTSNSKFQSDSQIYAKMLDVKLNQFEFTVNRGNAIITGFKDSTAQYVVVPPYLDNFPVKEISENAFKNKNRLRFAVICEGIETLSGFRGCNTLTEIRIPQSVTKLGDYAFAECSWESFTISNQITKIGNYAFTGCKELKSVIISYNAISVGGKAFSRCMNLTSVTIENGAIGISEEAFIGGEAFSYCSNLSSMTIGNGVTRILDKAFYYCESLTSVTIPDSVTSIGRETFYGCTELTNVTIGSGIKEINSGAFFQCQKITNVYFNGSLASWCEITSQSSHGLMYNKPTLYIGGQKVKGKLVIPDGVKSIAGYAFYGCKEIISVIIPNSVTNIGDSAFAYCSGLQSVIIPQSVKSIGKGAFLNCSALTSAVMGNDHWMVRGPSVAPTGIIGLSDPVKAVEYLTKTYCNCDWYQQTG